MTELQTVILPENINSFNGSNQKSYPCNDPNRPVCRQFVNQGKCNKRNHCTFYHPKTLTPIIKKKARRELGHCYCGAPQKTIISGRTWRGSDEDGEMRPNFFIICGKTGKSMKKCL